LSPWTPWKQSLWFWTYLQNIPLTFGWPPAKGPMHFWSLAVEEHYYLVWPLLVMRLRDHTLHKVAMGAVVVAVLTRILCFEYGHYFFTFARLDGLAIGSAIAIYERSSPQGLAPLLDWAKRLVFVAGSLLVFAQLILSGTGIPVIQVLKSTLVACVYSGALILAIEAGFGRIVGNVLSGRLLGSIGKYSYGMYVLHPFIIGWLFKVGLSLSLQGLVAAIGLTYAAAWVSWTVLEKRFLNLKRYFEYSQPKPIAEAVEVAR
jgi:peptidoglycan/LPS O-acetylase OafA/YrhL